VVVAVVDALVAHVLVVVMCDVSHPPRNSESQPLKEIER